MQQCLYQDESGFAENFQNLSLISNAITNDSGLDCLDEKSRSFNIREKTLKPEHIRVFTTQDEDGDSFLHVLLFHQESIVPFLRYTPGPSYLNVINELNQSLLMVSCIQNMPETTRLLILSGANFLLPDFKGDTALHLSVKYKRIECSKALLERFSWKEYKENENNLLYTRYDLPRIPSQKLMHMYNDAGLTPIHLAVLGKQYDILTLLWESGGNMAIPTKTTGDSPLHLAVRMNDQNSIQFLVEKVKVNLHKGNFANVSVLQLALAYRYSHIVKYLVENNVDTTELFIPIE